MKKNRMLKSLIIFITILAFTPFIQGGCGGGGGGGGGGGEGGVSSEQPATETERTLGTLDTSHAEGSHDVLDLEAIDYALGVGMDSGDVTASSADSGQTSISQKVEGILDRVKSVVPIGEVHASEAYADPMPEDCWESGTMQISATWDGLDEPASECEVSNINLTMTFVNCQDYYGDDVIDGTMVISIIGNLCDFTEMNILMNATISYDDGHEKGTTTFDNVSVDVNDIVWEWDEIVGMNMVVNGTISGNEDGIPFSGSYGDFSIGYAAVNDMTYGYVTEIIMDGYMQTNCIDGWVLVSTPEPLKFPYDNTDDCPTGGQVLLSGAGESEILLISNPGNVVWGKGLEIYVNGELYSAYSSCWDVESCEGMPEI